MKTFRILLPLFVDYYLTISRNSPQMSSAKSAEDIPNEKEALQRVLEEQRLTQTLDRIHMQIADCDKKSSILLAYIGVLLTVLFTDVVSGYVENVLLWPNANGIHIDNCARYFQILLLFAIICLIMASVIVLLLSLMAKVKLRNMNQNGMNGKYIIDYESISRMSFYEFSISDDDYLNDLRIQVYTTSHSCFEKFKHYTQGLSLLTLAMVLTIILVAFVTLVLLFS